MQKKDRNEKKLLALESWRILSDEWESGNLTQPEFCQLKNIKVKTFIKWRQKVLRAKETTEKMEQQTEKKTPKHFLPAHVISQSTQHNLTRHKLIPSVIMKLPNGLNVEIMADTKKVFLKDLFELLGVTVC